MERVYLYRCSIPEGLRVTTLVTPVAVDDKITSEAEIEQAVRDLKKGRAIRPSGMSVEDLKGCLQEATQERNPVWIQWQLVVQLIQRSLGDGTLTEELTWEK